MPDESTVIIVSSNRFGKISDNYAQKIYRILQGEFKEIPENTFKQYTEVYQLALGAKISAKFDENSQKNLALKNNFGEALKFYRS